MPKILVTILFSFAAVLIIASQVLFTVDETEQAIVLQFGQPVSGFSDELVKGPGLHVKLPFVQNVRYFDSRILSVDPQPERMNISSEKTVVSSSDQDAENIEAVAAEVSGEPILVDTFARYRIVDPLAFLKTLREIAGANSRIGGIMGNVTRNVLGQTTLREILSEKRSEIMLTIRDEVNRAMKDGGFGVEIVDIRIVRADLTQKLRASTVNRMITERRQAATETRARGREKALEIRSTAEKEKTVLLANAQRDSQIIRAEGDKEAIRIYAKAFNRDPSFYAFLRSMEAYGNVLDSEETQMILSPDSEFLRYFKNK
jgi:membrane protease subunit HflC